MSLKAQSAFVLSSAVVPSLIPEPGIAVAAPDRFPVRVWLISFLGWTFDFYDLILFSFLLIPIGQDLKLSESQEALLLGVALGASGIGGILFGYLSDRFGRKRVMTWTIGLYSLGTALCAFSVGPLSLLRVPPADRAGRGRRMGRGPRPAARSFSLAHARPRRRLPAGRRAAGSGSGGRDGPAGHSPDRLALGLPGLLRLGGAGLRGPAAPARVLVMEPSEEKSSFRQSPLWSGWCVISFLAPLLEGLAAGRVQAGHLLDLLHLAAQVSAKPVSPAHRPFGAVDSDRAIGAVDGHAAIRICRRPLWPAAGLHRVFAC